MRSIRFRLSLSRLSIQALCLGAALAGCSSTFPAVIEPGEIAVLRESRPKISRVRDLGAAHIGRPGPLLGESDGLYAIGELVLIEGSGFGKQPTVEIAGRPAEIRWRTAGGGIVVQVPSGSATGAQPVSVQSSDGKATATIELSRIATLIDIGRGELLALRISQGADGKPTVSAAGPALHIAGVSALAVSYDGAAAYALTQSASGDKSSITIVDLVAPGGPKATETRGLAQRAFTLCAAERAGVLAIVGTDQLTLWDVREARRPAPWAAAELPPGARNARAAALHPDGTMLALAIPTDNQVVLVDVKPGLTVVAPKQTAALTALPGIRQPLVHGLRFASDGATLWLSSGDSAASLSDGHQPTRITAIEVRAASAEQPDLGVAILKSVDLRDAGAPVQLALGRTPPVSAGTTIRTPPEKAMVFLTTVSTASGKPADSAARGALWRSDLGGHIAPVPGGKDLVTGIDVSPDAKLAVVAHISAAGRSVSVSDLESKQDVSLPIGAAEASDLAPPFDRLQIVLQP